VARHCIIGCNDMSIAPVLMIKRMILAATIKRKQRLHIAWVWKGHTLTTTRCMCSCGLHIRLKAHTAASE